MEMGVLWVDSREVRESTAPRKDRIETEIAGRTGFWDVGAYERVSVAPGNLFRVGEIELAWEDTAYSRALLGCTIDFVQGKWRVLEAGA